MSDQLKEAAERLIDTLPEAAAFDVATQGMYLALVREAVGRLGWGTMTYACKACAFEWEVWLSLGVEGPAALRDASLYTAAPFSSGRCPAWPNMQTCPGEMFHVRLREDRRFEPALIPDDAPRFVLRAIATRGDEGASLVIPEPALIRARRAGNP